MDAFVATESLVRAALRGLGRSGYRSGLLAHQAVSKVATVIGRSLSADERRHVMAGWAAERAEVCS